MNKVILLFFALWITYQAQTYMNISYNNGSTKNSVDVDNIYKWTFSPTHSFIFLDADNSAVSQLSSIDKISFGSTAEGDILSKLDVKIPSRNYALEFDGADDRVVVGNVNIGDPLMLANSDFTFTFWIKPKLTGHIWQRIISKSDGGSGRNGYDLMLSNYPSDRGLILCINGVEKFSLKNILTADVWQHVAVTGNSSGYAVYVNGIQKLEPAGNVTEIPNVSTNFMLGAICSGSGREFKGQLDEIQIWNTARTHSEIVNSMCKTLNGTESNLVAYYKFNSGTGSSVADSKSNGNHNGTMTNMTVDDWVISGIPVGSFQGFVNNGNSVSCGPAGCDFNVQCTSGGNASNYLMLYMTGSGSGIITSPVVGDWPGNVNRRFDIIWGVKEIGDVTADLVFNYSNVEGINSNTNIKLLKRSDEMNEWVDITSMATIDYNNKKITLNGQNSFSEFTIAEDTGNPLPVELTEFFAIVDSGDVILKWVTESEVNNYGFEIERSLFNETGLVEDTLFWYNIGFVEGHGNSNSPKEYQFTDRDPPNGGLKYRLKQIDTDGSYNYYEKIVEFSESITSVKEIIPTEFKLYQNYPNPFNPVTKIKYDLPQKSKVDLKVYNVLGELIYSLVTEEKIAGSYVTDFDASQIASGIYFCRMNTNEYSRIIKMILIK